MRTLEAITTQRLDGEIELLVCDSGSSDGTVGLARAHGARVIEIPQSSFSHGATRNLLMSQARGAITSRSSPRTRVPAGTRWLAALLGGFAVTQDVGLVFGPYLARPDASLERASRARGLVRLLRPTAGRGSIALAPDQRALPARDFWGPLGYFTDANGCVSRAAWERAPFREVAYAEDHLLAQDMLRAGYAKVYVPDRGGGALARLLGLGVAAAQLRRGSGGRRGLRRVAAGKLAGRGAATCAATSGPTCAWAGPSGGREGPRARCGAVAVHHGARAARGDARRPRPRRCRAL